MGAELAIVKCNTPCCAREIVRAAFSSQIATLLAEGKIPQAIAVQKRLDQVTAHTCNLVGNCGVTIDLTTGLVAPPELNQSSPLPPWRY